MESEFDANFRPGSRGGGCTYLSQQWPCEEQPKGSFRRLPSSADIMREAKDRKAKDASTCVSNKGSLWWPPPYSSPGLLYGGGGRHRHCLQNSSNNDLRKY